MRRASADLVAERCDAVICPESGEKRCAVFIRSAASMQFFDFGRSSRTSEIFFGLRDKRSLSAAVRIDLSPMASIVWVVSSGAPCATSFL
jgi:hypothetical protein